jgi:hypothetical protein
MNRDDHVVKMVVSIMHNHEPNLVCGESSHSSRRILSDGIRLAIAIFHRDRFERTGHIARRGGQEHAAHPLGLPRTRRERPRSRAAEQRDELAALIRSPRRQAPNLRQK